MISLDFFSKGKGTQGALRWWVDVPRANSTWRQIGKDRSARTGIRAEYGQLRYAYTHWFRAVVVFSPYTAPCNRSVSDCIPSSPRRTSWTTSSVESCVSSDPPTICSCALLARCSVLSLKRTKQNSNVAVRNVHNSTVARIQFDLIRHLADRNQRSENWKLTL